MESLSIAQAKNMAVSYRLAVPGDALCISVLAMQVFLDTYATDGVRPDLAREVLSVYNMGDFQQRLADPTVCIVLAEQRGHLVGFAEIRTQSQLPTSSLLQGTELVRLYIQRHWQRCGIGQTLLARTETLMREANQSLLWLTAWSGNESAHAFYIHQGFEVVGHTEYRIEGQAYDNRIYQKWISP